MKPNVNHDNSPYASSVTVDAKRNHSFRTVYWTGKHMQMTLMSIPYGGEIGIEMHSDTDQMIRVECGTAVVRVGECEQRLNTRYRLDIGMAVFVPSGTWHNVVNIGSGPLKISSIYAPPQH